MIEGLKYWTFEEMQKGCRILSFIGKGGHAEQHYKHFVLVPYHDFSTSNTALTAYRQKIGLRFGAYCARVDLTDVRHVVFGFDTEDDREALIEHGGIVTRRTTRKVTHDWG